MTLRVDASVAFHVLSTSPIAHSNSKTSPSISRHSLVRYGQNLFEDELEEGKKGPTDKQISAHNSDSDFSLPDSCCFLGLRLSWSPRPFPTTDYFNPFVTVGTVVVDTRSARLQSVRTPSGGSQELVREPSGAMGLLLWSTAE